MKAFNFHMILVWLLCCAAGGLAAFKWGFPIPDDKAVYLKAPSIAVLGVLIAAMTSWRTTGMPKLKDAYDSEEHLSNVDELIEAGTEIDYYGGFDRLGAALACLTAISAVGCVIQFGGFFIPGGTMSSICLADVISTLGLFTYLQLRIRRVEHFLTRRQEQEKKKSRGIRPKPNHSACAG